MTAAFVDRVVLQHRLFSQLSRMFGSEVPLYDKALLVNTVCNRAVCDLLAVVRPGFAITDEEIERTSGERHGAIRIGRPDEYRWMARFFAVFAMEPHNFYDMSSVGVKSQPVIATAYRSAERPEHRVFCSLLIADYFDADTRARIEALLARRAVFSDRAKSLIERCERDGGLTSADADALIAEATGRIFKWTGLANDKALYDELCDAGFKIAADIACFESHHLNHLTPNTLCMDLYTSAMKRCLWEIDDAEFSARATRAMTHLAQAADDHHLRLHFKHLSWENIDALRRADAASADVSRLVAALVERLAEPDLNLSGMNHNGFKDFTEGPSADTPVLLRQDAYKALTEPVVFRNADGSSTPARHTARFGEIEQRFYATTPAGRDLYDACLARAEARRERDPGLARRDAAAYEADYAACFDPFPKTLRELVDAGLVYARYEPTAQGLSARGAIDSTNIAELVRRGFVRVEGLRYEDFLPVSAAGIFASNLNQYGTRSTAQSRPVYTKADLEAIIGRSIIDTDEAYRDAEAASIRDTLAAIGVGRAPLSPVR